MKNAPGISNCRSVLALSLLAALPLGAFAGKTVSSSLPLTTYIYSTVVDEQQTATTYCTGVEPYLLRDVAGLSADSTVGPTSAWNVFLSPWTEETGMVSGTYDNGANCVSSGSCLRAEFSTSYKVFSLDMRTTSPLRKVTLDFTDPWNPDPNTPAFGSSLSTTGLLQVSGLDSFTSMSMCSTRACPEYREIATKFWFNDPSNSSVTWRVDWSHIRVLRVSQKTWYFIADACGGSQVAGLSKLEGNRTRPRETLNGYYLVPLFFSATLK